MPDLKLKQYVKKWLEAKGWEYKDFGTYTTDSCDYPDFAHPLALAVENGECYPGIAICGSGEGIGITLNKHQGIRAALAGFRNRSSARQHNNANVLVMPGRFIDEAMADKIMTEFFTTDLKADAISTHRQDSRSIIPRSCFGEVLFDRNTYKACFPEKGNGLCCFY